MFKTKEMIPANELRIGNWVSLIALDQKIIVESISKTGIGGLFTWVEKGEEYEDSLSGIEGILLEPDLLLACGFKYGVSEGITRFSDDINEEKEQGDTHYWDYSITQTEIIDSHNISIVKWGEQDHFTFQLERGFYRQKIKYLHDLQNLLFFIDRKELEITY